MVKEVAGMPIGPADGRKKAPVFNTGYSAFCKVFIQFA